jgi:hypothetical protein
VLRPRIEGPYYRNPAFETVEEQAISSSVAEGRIVPAMAIAGAAGIIGEAGIISKAWPEKTGGRWGCPGAGKLPANPRYLIRFRVSVPECRYIYIHFVSPRQAGCELVPIRRAGGAYRFTSRVAHAPRLVR